MDGWTAKSVLTIARHARLMPTVHLFHKFTRPATMAKSNAKASDGGSETPAAASNKGLTEGKPCVCEGCGASFPSKNALFRHLRETVGKCLPPHEYEEFLIHVVNNQRNLDKIGVLYGYLPSQHYLDGGEEDGIGVTGGDLAAVMVLQAIDRVSLGAAAGEASARAGKPPKTTEELLGKVNRSYGFNSRCAAVEGLLEQDAHTGAMSELLCSFAPPLLGSEEDGSAERERRKWIDEVNAELKRAVGDLPMSPGGGHPGEIRVFGRVHISNKRFNPEIDATVRRIEYLMPLDFLVPAISDESKGVRIPRVEGVHQTTSDRQYYFDSTPSFRVGKNSRLVDHDTSMTDERPSPEALTYLFRLKKLMQRMTTHVVAVEGDTGSKLEKDFSVQSRKKAKGRSQAMRDEKRDERRKKKGEQEDDGHDAEVKEGPKSSSKKVDGKKKQKKSKDAADATSTKSGPVDQYKGTHVLKRKRFHNFSPQALAHDYLSFRRMDRFWHKATIRYEEDQDDELLRGSNRPFVLLSLTGDAFLNCQARSVMALLVAICQGVIDEDIIDCIFDEEYPSLVPAPVMPRTGMYHSEAQYMSWEGRLFTVLNARRNGNFDRGWSDDATNTAVEEWRERINRETAKAWYRGGISEENDQLQAEKTWFSNHLIPWAARANEQLKDYRRWKQAQRMASDNPSLSLIDALLPPLDSADSRVPQLFALVLKLLQEADASGRWPTTTAKRQMVMVSTNKDNGTAVTESLSSARWKAITNHSKGEVSAYSLAEGQGGASGSFSVGAMPPGVGQPKANEIFPELMKAAFELEIALCPDREPSSTIAVNRNAQFRPHTDSGAGAGQSTSLIVGLGHYVGGELMVEGEKKDIRYEAVTFNGWKQRHWTLPFVGERYSLVWFTPKGCEGLRGIDLCS